MNEQVTIYNKDRPASIRRGKELQKKNKFFSEFGELMGDPKVRKFAKKHLSEWENIKTTMMFIKLYEHIYPQVNDHDICIDLIDKIIKNPDARSTSVQHMQEFMGKRPQIKYE